VLGALGNLRLTRRAVKQARALFAALCEVLVVQTTGSVSSKPVETLASGSLDPADSGAPWSGERAPTDGCETGPSRRSGGRSLNELAH